MSQKIVRLQQGDSFTMNFIVRENGIPKDIDVGNEDIIVGFYDQNDYKYVIKFSDGKINPVNNAIGCYHTTISSDVTKNFVGYVDVEIAVQDIQSNDISHADKILKMYFDERKLNEDI